MVIVLGLEMARQLQLSTFSSAKAEARLQAFILSGVSQTGRKLGEGAYGCVEELRIDGLMGNAFTGDNKRVHCCQR